MKYTLIAGTVLLFAAACSPKTAAVAPVEPSKPNVPTAPAEPERTPAASSDAAIGESLYNAYCGRCHDLPVVKDYTAAQWEHILPEMAKKSRLTTEQENQVTAYVKAQLK